MALTLTTKNLKKMKRKNIHILGAALLMTTPAFSTTPDNHDGVKQTVTVNQETVDGTVSEIRIDGNNAVLQFADGTSLTADMRLVTITMSYNESTKVNQLRVTDKDGDVKVYDLQGRRVDSSKLRNGIYVVNGQKVTNKKK